MRVPGPRTLIRYVILVSLPSLVMFIYIISQTLPLALKTSFDRNEFSDLPLMLTIPHEGAGLGGKEEEFSEHEAASIVPEVLENTTEAGPQPELLPPGLWKYLDASPDGDDLNLGAIDDMVSSKPVYVDPIWSLQSKNFSKSNFLDDNDEAMYNIPSTPSLPVQFPDLAMNVVPEDPNKPTLQQLEDYFLSNYKMNMEKGKSRFSLGVTEATIEQGPLTLPELLPNLQVPCWVEDVPTDFTYDSNIYHCHINNRRIKTGFDRMFSTFMHRQSYHGFKWRIRCLPSFYLIGVAKCGTTDLFEALTRHPKVVRPDLKEPEFWPYLRFGLNDLILNMTCASDKGRATFAEYLDTFDWTSEMVKEALTKDKNGDLTADVLFGDYSTHTFIDIFGWDKSLDAPDQVNADHIFNVWPKSKFIIILRDPIDRSYSRYKMRLARQDNVAGTPMDFHKRVLKQVETTTECLEEHSERYCVYKATFGKGNLGTNALLNTGMYVIYLKDWLKVFPLDHFLIIRFEDYIYTRMETIDNISKFLGMEMMPAQYRSIVDSMSITNAGRDIGSVLPETRQALQKFYRPFNHELAELLGDEKLTFGY